MESTAGLAFAVLAWWVGKRVSQPIEQLAQVAQAISAGKHMEFDVPARTTELNQLNQSLRTMATTLLQHQQELTDLNRDLESIVAERTAELAEANKVLQALIRQDPLTGLANRLAANDWLDTQFRLVKRHKVPYAVLGIDIDYFKKVNDTFGHATGDSVLKHVAIVLMNSVRDTDLVARMGGEEFLVILPMTYLHDAKMVAEKIRSNVESASLEPVGRVTLSIGIAMATADDSSPEVAVKTADEMLYEAKKLGRNRVQTASNPATTSFS